ncbi:MAG: tetratricopeptide repeat protein [Deltaproteobacteria bacterium]|nr:tetratricopeptide repeat protein [Deltaproteobacteria bacterium]
MPVIPVLDQRPYTPPGVERQEAAPELTLPPGGFGPTHEEYGKLFRPVTDALLRQPHTAVTAARDICRLNRHDPVCALELARQVYVAGDRERAEKLLQSILAGGPHALALSMLGFFRMESGNAADAMQLFSQALAADPGECAAHINMRRLKNALRTMPQRDALPLNMTVATSLPPQNIEASRLAVDSWRKLGFRVLSVNTAGECAMLAPLFPEVDFYVCNESAKPITGRDHQYLDALLDALFASASPVCAIINADILLQGGTEAWGSIVDAARRDCVFGSRVDVASPTDRSGHIYHPGYDFFCFPRACATAIPRTGFVIGRPFWDMFVPMQARLSGYTTRLCLSPAALHVLHDNQWDTADFLRFGMQLVEAGAPVLAGALRFSGAFTPYHLNFLSRLRALLHWEISRSCVPLLCDSPEFDNFMAPVDPLYWDHPTPRSLVLW